MRVSLNWLREFVDIDIDVDDLTHKLTMLGLEIESVEKPGAEIQDVVIGKVLSVDPHPDADKLVVCKTDVGGSEPLQIVCGATNMKAGDLVPTAVVGATLPEGFKIARRKMRGIESQGMMCSARELGLGDDHLGLLILDPDLPVGENAVPLLGLDDVVFDIEVTPNRADWASMIGVARELAALLETPLRIPEIPLTESGKPAAELSSVTIEDPDLCPRYIGRVLTGVKVGPSPLWMCRRLISGGLRPINNIVDITNYVLLETGHPLHAFDYDLLAENRIVVRRARDGETMLTIDEQDHVLTSDMLIIADAKEPIAVAGVMGGHDSEVGERTVNVFLESAYFDPVSVRRTARALGMQTEASLRFQRGADPEMAEYAVDRAAALMQELAGATVHPGKLDEYPAPLEPIELTLRYDRTNLLLGASVAPKDQRKFLANLGFQMVGEDRASCSVRVPLRRNDVRQEADLIEEVARLYGYDNIPSNLPRVAVTDNVFAPHDKKLRGLREFLVGLGLTEMMGMTFSAPSQVERAGLDGAYLDMVTLENPLSEQHATMRSSLIPGLLAAVSTNLRHGSPNIKAFELGPVYRPNPAAELPDQHTRIGVIYTGHEGRKHWSKPEQPLDLYDLKGLVEAVLDWLSVAIDFVAIDFRTMAPGQCGQVVVREKPVGVLGQVSEQILAGYDIEQPVYLAEIDLDPLLESDGQPTGFHSIAIFPPSLRDMAVLVDETVPAGNVCAAAQKAGGKLLSRVDIFDVYTGKQVPAGKKSIALSLVLQSTDRTLTDKDTQKTWDKILKTLEDNFQAELR